MSLLDFSKNKPAPAIEPRPFMVMIFPAEARVGVIGEQWRRLDDGRIEATYWTVDQFRAAMWVTREFLQLDQMAEFRQSGKPAAASSWR